mgnify:CR=1 FL=1
MTDLKMACCPFCREKMTPRYLQSDSKGYFVVCPTKLCTIGPKAQSRSAAVSKWNGKRLI